MDNDRDRALLSRCRQGDRDAFTTLVASYERPVFAVAYRMLGSATDAADAVQSVFLKMFEHLDGYDAKYKVFSWIYRIAVNESLDRLQWRKHNGMSQCNPGADASMEGRHEERIASTDEGPEGLAEAGQLHDVLQEAIMELQQDHRAVIVLRHYSGCSYEEMATILNVPEKTVKSRLYGARQALKKSLSAHGVEAA